MMFRTPAARACRFVAVTLLLTACSSPEEQKQRHFEQGNAYVADKRDDFAVIEYANAVRIDPKFGEARLKLAETYDRMGNIQAAFPEYIRAADALPGNRGLQLKATQLLLLAQRFDDAKARATALLEKNPEDVDALLLRANAMAQLRDLEGALREIEDALKIQPDEERAYLSRADVQVRGGQREEAEKSFRRAVELQPSAANPRLAYANFLWSEGRATEAEQQIREAVAAEPRDLMANRMLAALFAATKRPSEAEAPLKVVADVSGRPAAKFELAQFYAGVGRTDEAIKLLTELERDPSSAARAELMIAEIEYRKGDTRTAHGRLDKLLTRTPNDAVALALKAQWLGRDNKLDEALERAKAAVKADPRLVQAHFVLGQVQSGRRDIPEAIKAYTEVLRLNPRVAAAQIELSRLNALSGNKDASLRYAEEAKQTAPASVSARVALVRSLLARSDLERAGAELADLLRGAPSAAVHALNGTYLVMRKDQRAARAAYERALQMTPGHLEAVRGLISLDVANKDYGPAIKRVDAELAKRPDQVELMAIASRVYEEAGQPQRAEQLLRQAVAKDPQFQNGYAGLAQLYMKQRRVDDARREFETMVKRDPRAVGARTMVGILLQSQGKRDEARRWYEATVAEIPNAPVVANNLAFIYAEDGVNLDTALKLAQTARKELPDNPDVSDTLGWVYYKKELPSLAVGPLEESVKQRPDNPQILYHLGMTYAKLNEKAKAREALERALKLSARFPGADDARQTLSAVSQ
jgi:putative PEP-CTERM system TPR-repeat lipoprotein